LGFLSILPDLLLPPKESWHLMTWLSEVALGPFRNDVTSIKNPFWITGNPLNQSLRGALARVIDEFNQPRQFAMVLHIVVGLYVLCVGLLMLKSLRHDRLIPVDGAILVISMLLLSPVTSKSHLVMLMLPYTILAAALIRDRSTRIINAIVLATSFLLATASSGDLASHLLSSWSFQYSLITWGVLVLIVSLGVLIWSRQHDSRNSRQ